MNRIEKMIKKMCPEGVERVKLGEVCENLDRQRKPITGHNRIAGKIPYYGASGVVDYVRDYIFDEDLLLISEDGANLIARNSPIAFSVTGKTWVNNHAHVMRFKEYSTRKLVEYYLNKLDLTPWISGGAQPKLNQENLNKIEIPLPPLPIQQEIVNILDNFTALQQNLEDELAMRQKQYEHYREKLLTFEEGECEWKKLGEVSLTVYAGATPSTKIKEYWEDGDIRWMSSGEVHQGQVKEVAGRITKLGYEKCSTKMVPVNSIVIALAGQGKTRGTVAITRVELCTNQSICAVVPDVTKAIPDYMYYYLKGQYMNLRQVSSGDGTRGGLNLKMINGYEIPVPPLSKQLQIVQTLDRFESLISNLKTEIELRKKQYEYYREKLLTF